MPWFPDFASAVELARQQTRAAGLADPVGQYFAALNKGDTHVLETVPHLLQPVAGRRAASHPASGTRARSHPPQAGLGVYERGPDGLLAAARVYDDIEPPAKLP